MNPFTPFFESSLHEALHGPGNCAKRWYLPQHAQYTIVVNEQ